MAEKSSQSTGLDVTRLPLEDELSWRLDIARDELRMLYAALDNVQSGLLLLDSELRARYSNQALHALFKNAHPESIRDTRPRYEELLEGAQNIPAEDKDDYIRRRLAWVKSAGSEPMDLSLRDGSVIRCQVASLPDGGRMLIYSDVTDIVRAAEELERLATIDGMTGIYNRRHFLTLADHEWVGAHRYHRPLSFLMIDIDNFKNVNDTFGHQVGDAVIVRLAEMARSCKRDSDVLARVGGEEFALLLPETGLRQANVAAERLRKEVSCAQPPVEKVNVTVSIGVAVATDEMNDFSALMQAADAALYEAKRSGRNRVVCLQDAR